MLLDTMLLLRWRAKVTVGSRISISPSSMMLNYAEIIAETESAGDAKTWTARMEAWDEKIALLFVETEDGYLANHWPLTEKKSV